MEKLGPLGGQRVSYRYDIREKKRDEDNLSSGLGGVVGSKF